MISISELILSAEAARSKARAAYSNFHVGAGLLTAGGKIYSGCNIESSSYGLTICAERVALFKALSEGETEFQMLALVTDARDYCPPCGACRQVLWDYARNIQIVLARNLTDYKIFSLADLLPQAFEDHFLK